MKTTWRVEIPQLAVLGLMFVGAAVTLPTAPERVPIHWGVTGRPDGYAAAFPGLFAIPAVTLATYLLLLVIPAIDPGRASYATFADVYLFVRRLILAFFAVIDAVVLLAIRGVAVDVSLVIPLVVGALLVLLGNVMGKIRPNWFVGIRTPWTLSSKLSWTRTHAVGGRVFVVVGLAFLLAPLSRATGLGSPALWSRVDLAVVAVGVVFLVVYSYLVWRSDPERVPPAGTLPSDGHG